MAKVKQPEAGDAETGVQSEGVAQGGGTDQRNQASVGEDGSPAQSDVSSLVTAAPIVVAKLIKARVLLDCAHGKCDDVIEIDAAHAKSLADVLDTDPAAVAYAESLAAQQ